MYFAEKLTERQRSVYWLISSSGGKTHKEIIASLALPARTVRHAISVLRDSRLIVAQMSGSDLRSPVYFLAGKSGTRPFASSIGEAREAV